jgi:hypothetical protein
MADPRVSFALDPQPATGGADTEDEFKTQHRQLLENKLKTQKRIEAMRREYDFISKLDTNDVTYVMSKKQE